MNLNKLFEKQRELDARILLEKGLVGQDLLDKKILALQVELGELANEWRRFKFWSNDQEPRTSVIHKDPQGQCAPIETNPLLEEYVDCLHFILSIGLELDCEDLVFEDFKDRRGSITKQFNYNFHAVATLDEVIVCGDPQEEIENVYGFIVGGFIVLGEMLGFTWEQIEQAYLDKNKINHERQENGY